MYSNQSFAGFTSIDAAQSFRSEAGGWIFKAENGQIIWFAMSFTPSKILLHTATAGLSGSLV
ncbi:hypothetical protein [Pseudomonas sp. LS-2]|uniref:hypothetical protein n=1 Tax=Pseudomonas sp. LS-2 TaxID=2315859 RepID=UPI000E761AED|nr:hypothetical protein [Pseudomonas sp. LS-2]RJX82265.1 hypothetical protein D3M70_06730 [Pseudomonas sp. LS-2]